MAILKPGDTFFFEPLDEVLVVMEGGCGTCVADKPTTVPNICQSLPTCANICFMRVADAVTFKLTGELPHVPDHD